MNTNEKTIPIFFAANDTYAGALDVAMLSLIENASKEYDYNIHILYDDLSKENRDLLSRHNAENVNVIFNNVENALLPIKDTLPDKFYFTLSSYHRLFIEKMFPEYDKAIYIDCDIVVVDDISKLYNIDVKDNLFGCVNEQNNFLNPLFTAYITTVTGIDPYKYFNSGMLLLNLKRIREFNLFDKFVKVLTTYNFESPAVDQDYLNNICRDKVLLLENGWNRESVESVPLEGKLHIRHYALMGKPWLTKDVPDFELFWEYAKKSVYYEQLKQCLKNASAHPEQGGKMMEGFIELVNRLLKSEHTFKKQIVDKGIYFD